MARNIDNRVTARTARYTRGPKGTTQLLTRIRKARTGQEDDDE